MRLEKNPSAAAETFKAMLKTSVTGDHLIYLITEKEHLALLPEGVDVGTKLHYEMLEYTIVE